MATRTPETPAPDDEAGQPAAPDKPVEDAASAAAEVATYRAVASEWAADVTKATLGTDDVIAKLLARCAALQSTHAPAADDYALPAFADRTMAALVDLGRALVAVRGAAAVLAASAG